MSTIQESQLLSSLTEYQELRAEIRQLQSSQLKLYSFIITTIIAAIGASLTTKVVDVILVLPILGTGFAFRYLWHNNILNMLSSYLELMDQAIFKPLLGIPGCNHNHALGARATGNNAGEILWIGWQSYFTGNYRLLPFHKFANQLLFVLFPFVPAVVLCCVNLFDLTGNQAPRVQAQFPGEVYLFCLIFLLPTGIYVAVKLWEAE